MESRHSIPLLSVQAGGIVGDGDEGSGIGAAIGAVGGAVIGAVVGGPVGAAVGGAAGAAVGATVGAVVGGVSGCQLLNSNYLTHHPTSHTLSILHPDCWVVQKLSRPVLGTYKQP